MTTAEQRLGIYRENLRTEIFGKKPKIVTELPKEIHQYVLDSQGKAKTYFVWFDLISGKLKTRYMMGEKFVGGERIIGLFKETEPVIQERSSERRYAGHVFVLKNGVCQSDAGGTFLSIDQVHDLMTGHSSSK